MKKSILIIVLLSTFLFGQHCSAQVNRAGVSSIKFSEIKSVILKNYKVEQSFIDTCCVNTVILVKFKILNARIDSIEFTKTVPLPIKRALEKVLQIDRGGLRIIDGESYENKTIVIPINFVYLSACKTPDPIQIDSNGVIRPAKRPETSLVLALMDAMNFESGYKLMINCILLSPMHFTQMY